MVNLGTVAIKIFHALELCDMRKSFNGLTELATRYYQAQPARATLFVFTNKNRTRIKLLYFDGTGLWVAVKRLEKGRFSWPKPSDPSPQRIYQIEKQLRQAAAPATCRELIRRTRRRPIAQELHRCVSEAQQRHLPGSYVAKAINYTLN